MKKIVLSLIPFLYFFALHSQQIFVSKDWSSININDAGQGKVLCKFDPNGNVVTFSNSFNSGPTADLVLKCSHANGIPAWNKNCTSNNYGDDEPIDMEIDDLGDLYILGTKRVPGNSNIVVAKYLPNGASEWYKEVDVSSLDEGAKLFINTSYIFVTGTIKSSNSFKDLIVLCLDKANGNQVWSKIYDYQNKNEYAYDIKSDDSGNPVVLCNSYNSIQNTEVSLLRFNRNNGSLMNEYRASRLGNNIDIPKKLIVNSNTFYISGSLNTSSFGSGESFIQKLDNNFNSIWEYVSQNNGSTELVDIEQMPNGNIAALENNFVNGVASATISFISIASGSKYFETSISPPIEYYEVSATDLDIESTRGLFVSSNYFLGGSKSTMLTNVSFDGVEEWNKTLVSNVGQDYNSTIVGTYDSKILNASTTIVSGENIVELTMFDSYPKDKPILLDSAGNPYRNAEIIIVKFAPSSVNFATIDDKQIQHASIEKFLTPQAFSELENLFVDLKIDIGNTTAYKIFPRMTSADSMSMTRSGRMIKLNKHYLTLGLILPTGTNDEELLNRLKNSQLTSKVGFNYFANLHVGANDPEFNNNNSAGLISTTNIPNANINIEPAWDHSTGSDSIKVGVYDSGINWEHADLGDGTYNNSIVTNGYDYFNNTLLNSSSSPDLYGHGTAIAGIIGAKRNNYFGVSGIAGGDYSNNRPGVQLHDMKIAMGNITSCSPTSFYTSIDIIANAIVEGCSDTPTGFGYAQHIQNHSWGGAPPYGFIHEAVITSYQNECAIVVSSGNDVPPGSLNPCVAANLPANEKDHLVFQVGANDSTGGRAYFSTCNDRIDFIAPGMNNLYSSLDRSGSGLADFLNFGPNCVAPINGTSFAAPHAAGLASLIMSYYKITAGVPNDLFPEDCQEMMKKFATDVDGIGFATQGYDPNTGYGRLNAGALFENFWFPRYMIKHYSIEKHTSSATLVASNQRLCLTESILGLPTGLCYVNKYEISQSFYSVQNMLPNGYTYLDAWSRGSASNLMEDNSIQYGGNWQYAVCSPTKPRNYLPDGTNNTIVYKSPDTLILKGYIYELLDSNFNSVGWYPLDTNSYAQFAWSIYMEDSTQTLSTNGVSIEDSGLKIYPNPSNNIVNITFEDSNEDIFELEVFLIDGRSLYKNNNLTSKQTFQLNISSWSKGIYVFRIKYRNKTFSQKIIKE